VLYAIEKLAGLGGLKSVRRKSIHNTLHSSPVVLCAARFSVPGHVVAVG
jgi:hypothetical protein